MLDSDEIGTSQELTEESAAPFFAQLLSDEEDQQNGKEPPTQESPESESATEASTEQAESEADKSETEEEQEEAVAEQPKYRTKVNGVEIEVTLEEALRGYSRTQDYTQKTQELAEQRRRLETEIPAVRAERERTAALLSQLEQAVVEATPQEPDWQRLQQEQPEKFAETYAAWKLRQDQIQAIRQERQVAEEAVNRDRQQLRHQYVEEQKAKLIEAIPEWKNANIAKAEKAKLVQVAKEVGYGDEELAEVLDHRAIVLLRDAMKYREMKKKQPEIQSRIEKVKTATPGSGAGNSSVPKTATDRALARLEKTGTQEDAATVLLSKLQDW